MSRENVQTQVSLICEAIRRDPQRPWRIEDFTAAAGLGHWRLRHLFTAHTGVPLYQFVLTTRLDMAADLLASSEKQVKEVAFLVGMSSGLLCRRFRRKYGLSPLEWRQLVTDLRTEPASLEG